MEKARLGKRLHSPTGLHLHPLFRAPQPWHLPILFSSSPEHSAGRAVATARHVQSGARGTSSGSLSHQPLDQSTALRAEGRAAARDSVRMPGPGQSSRLSAGSIISAATEKTSSAVKLLASALAPAAGSNATALLSNVN